jgi:hypothetical protein
MHRHRQLHLWITEHDYLVLRSMAHERKETLSCVIRKLIKLHRSGTDLMPETDVTDGVPGVPPS